MVEQAWLDKGDMIVPKVFVEEHTNGKCVPTEKVRDEFDNFCDWLDNKLCSKKLLTSEINQIAQKLIDMKNELKL